MGIDELQEKYNINQDLLLVEKQLKKLKPKSILLQFPDGLKPYATEITDKIKELAESIQLKPTIKVWLGSCFGACDIPNSKNDLLIQFGHAPWN